MRDIKKRTKPYEVKHYISEKLKEYWSPQQIVGRLEPDRKIKISTETAYRFVLKGKAIGSTIKQQIVLK